MPIVVENLPTTTYNWSETVKMTALGVVAEERTKIMEALNEMEIKIEGLQM